MDREDFVERVSAHLRIEGASIDHRIDWSLLFHAILIEAFVSAEPATLALPIGLLGIFTSLVSSVIGMRQNWHWFHLFRTLISQDRAAHARSPFHRWLTQIRDEHPPDSYRWIRATPVFTIMIPLALFATWNALYWTKLVSSSGGWVWVTVWGVLLVATVAAARWLREGPEIDPAAMTPPEEGDAGHESH